MITFIVDFLKLLCTYVLTSEVYKQNQLIETEKEVVSFYLNFSLRNQSFFFLLGEEKCSCTSLASLVSVDLTMSFWCLQISQKTNKQGRNPGKNFIVSLRYLKTVAECLTQNPTILKMLGWNITTIFLIESFHILLPPL